MGNPLILVGVIGLLAMGLILFGMTRRGGKTTADDVMDRMGRFATREEFLAVGDGGDRRTPNKFAEGLEEMFKGREVTNTTASLITRADVKLTVGEFLMIRIGSAGAGAIIGFLIAARSAPVLGVLFAIVGALIGYFVPYKYLTMKANRRRKAFVNQLGDTITLMANSLRAGYSLLQTMEMVSRETKDPMATEFRRVVREVGLGISHKESMENLLRRIPSDDLDLLVTAINIQHEVGGNLAQILTTIGHTIRERVRIKGEISVLTAQVRFSSYLITAMPIALAVIVFMLNPSYIGSLFQWPWICMPIASSIMIVIGFLIMRKIANIEV